MRIARLITRLDLRRTRHIRRLLRLRNGIMRQVVISICRRIAIRVRRRIVIRVLRCIIKRIPWCIAVAYNPCGFGRRLRRGGVGITGVGNNASRIGAIASLCGAISAHHGRLVLVHATFPFRRLQASSYPCILPAQKPMMGKARRYLQDMRVPKDQKAPPSLGRRDGAG